MPPLGFRSCDKGGPALNPWWLDISPESFSVCSHRLSKEDNMYVVFVEELEGPQDPVHTARTLEQAFAQITCRCGYSYRFEPAQEQGWCLFLIDVARPERSPDPIHSSCVKPRDAHFDLMTQAVDGRLKGHVALHIEAYRRARVMRAAGGSAVRLEARG
jgi:hypothetical protein